MRVFLKGCSCTVGEKTVHTSKREFNEVEFITTIRTRCEICGNRSESVIRHDA